MKLTSPAFEHNQPIPSHHTCDGNNVSPALEIANLPANTESLTLLVNDPDSPSGDFLHWKVVGIPASTTQVAEGTEPEGTAYANDFGQVGWGGPCPGSGIHRYVFTLTAVDEFGVEVDKAVLIGTYARQR